VRASGHQYGALNGQHHAFSIIYYFGEELDDPPSRVCTENLIRVDDVMESPKLAE